MLDFIKKLLARLFGKKAEAIEHTFDGWVPDTLDARDHIYTPPKVTKTKALAPIVDITSKFGPVEQQGRLNSCVGHAMTSAIEAVLRESDKSRLFVYYNARAIEGRTGVDGGCQIRSAAAAATKQGAASEALWPYDAAQVLVKPPAAAYTDGLTLVPKILAYERVTTLDGLKGALASGLPVVFGFRVYSRFRTETLYTGICTYPVTGDTVIGAHAVVAVGYDDTTGMVKVRNSFGPTWGQAGYFYMPYQWFASMSSLVSDAWVIRPKV